MSSSEIFASCWATPDIENLSMNSMKFYKYSPLAIEASILSNAKAIAESTEALRRRLNAIAEKNCVRDSTKKFVEQRSAFLSMLSSEPKIKLFVRGIEGKAEEIRKSQQEIRMSLHLVGADAEIQKEILKESKLRLSTHDFLIDCIREKVLSGKKELRQPVLDYLDSFGETLQSAISNQSEPETVYSILAADIEFVAFKKEALRTSQSLAIPLDISPLRLSLSMIEDNTVYDHSRRYYPPLFLLYSSESRSIALARPYRTIDGHPIFMRAPQFEFDRNRAQHETSDAREKFSKQIGPLLYTLKGWSGMQEIAPSLIVDPIVQIVKSYLGYNPMSIDSLKILDLGCGTGALLRKVVTKVLEETSDNQPNSVYAFLNDDSQLNPGKAFRNLSGEERYSEITKSRTRKGDLRDLIIDLHLNNEKFDLAFINRVLDMYGGYGLFDFNFVPENPKNYCSSYTRKLPANEPNVGEVLVFSESFCHQDAWRAISYIFTRKTNLYQPYLFHLPSIDVKMKKNFFDYNGHDTLDKLLTFSKLLIVSIYPGSFESVFPEINSERDGIFYCELYSPTSYSVMCISHEKLLIDCIRTSITAAGD